MRTFALILCTLFFVACGGDDDNNGNDNNTPQSSEKAITGFTFEADNNNNVLDTDVTANISGTTITATVPFGTDVTALKPTINISDKATISPASDTAQNFTNPVTYTVTAEDGSNQDYTVTLTESGITVALGLTNITTFEEDFVGKIADAVLLMPYADKDNGITATLTDDTDHTYELTIMYGTDSTTLNPATDSDATIENNTLTFKKVGYYEINITAPSLITSNTLKVQVAPNIPDDVFRAHLQDEIPNAFEGDLLDPEHTDVTGRPSLFPSDNTINPIKSLEGIAWFTSLTILDCFANQLTTLDVSQNTSLTELDCSLNQLNTLNLPQNTSLTTLRCNENQLTTLDVSQNTSLALLRCNENQLTTLDVSQNASLTNLSCGDNQLTTLDVSQNTSLTTLSCGDNQLATLDVSKNMSLTHLFCEGNRLATLDVFQNTSLTTLSCGDNQLADLDVSQNTSLERLQCSSNQLATLNVSQNTSLTRLSCGGNQLTALNISQNTSLEELECQSNQLTALDLSNNVRLFWLNAHSNQLTALDVSDTRLTLLRCYNNPLSTLILPTTEFRNTSDERGLWIPEDFQCLDALITLKNATQGLFIRLYDGTTETNGNFDPTASGVCGN